MSRFAPAVAAVALLATVFLSFCTMKWSHLHELEESVGMQWKRVEADSRQKLGLYGQLLSKTSTPSPTPEMAEARDTALRHQDQAREALQRGDPGAVRAALGELSFYVRRCSELHVRAVEGTAADPEFLLLHRRLEASETTTRAVRQEYDDVATLYNAEVRNWNGIPLCSGFMPRPRFEDSAW